MSFRITEQMTSPPWKKMNQVMQIRWICKEECTHWQNWQSKVKYAMHQDAKGYIDGIESMMTSMCLKDVYSLTLWTY